MNANIVVLLKGPHCFAWSDHVEPQKENSFTKSSLTIGYQGHHDSFIHDGNEQDYTGTDDVCCDMRR